MKNTFGYYIFEKKIKKKMMKIKFRLMMEN